MTLIPERLWTQMSTDEQQLVRDTMAGMRTRAKQVTCPHCAKAFRISVSYTIQPGPPSPEDEVLSTTVTEALKPSYSAKDAELVDSAKRCGLFDAFAHAAREERQFSGVPHDLEDFFLRFWQRLARVDVPRVALAAWITEFGGRIEVWGADGVLAILSNGEIKAFVPNRYVRSSGTTTMAKPQTPRAANFERWTKSKFGYVPVGSDHFAAALRQRNMGLFGRSVQ
jgi:hypothetical protein